MRWAPVDKNCMSYDIPSDLCLKFLKDEGLPRAPCHTCYQSETSGTFWYISKKHQHYLRLRTESYFYSGIHLNWHIKRNSHAKNDQAIFACYEYYKSDERHIHRKFHTILFFFFFFFSRFFFHFCFFIYFVSINPHDLSFFSFFLWHLIWSFSVTVVDRAKNCFAFYWFLFFFRSYSCSNLKT